MMMKTVSFETGGIPRLRPKPVPELAALTDVRVRVKHSGICGTDRAIVAGKFHARTGVTLGHESVGIVEHVGPAVVSLRAGDRVVINPTLYCGRCSPCLAGQTAMCAGKTGNEVGVDRDGTFAEYIVLPETFVRPLPDSLSFDRAVFIEPLACCLNNVDAARVSSEDTVLIVGGGPIGVLLAMTVHARGAEVHVAEQSEFRRRECQRIFAQAAAPIGVHGPGNPFPHRSASVVFDAVGCLLEECIGYASSRARIVVMGYHAGAVAQVRPLELLQRALTLIGAGDYSGEMFERALKLVHRLPAELLITMRVPLEAFGDAFEALAIDDGRSYGVMKALIVSDGAQ